MGIIGEGIYCLKSNRLSIYASYIQDVYEDFIKENSLTNISKGNKRFITSVGSLGFDIFCSTMNKLNK